MGENKENIRMKFLKMSSFLQLWIFSCSCLVVVLFQSLVGCQLRVSFSVLKFYHHRKICSAERLSNDRYYGSSHVAFTIKFRFLKGFRFLLFLLTQQFNDI